jgi:fucose permease
MRRRGSGYCRLMPRLLGALDRDSRRLYAGFLANFALFGVTMTLVGATLPRLIREHGWSYTTSGAVLSASSVGYFVATFSVGLLIHRLGARRVVMGGLVVEALGLALFGRFPSAALNILLSFAVGIGQGCVEVVTNFGVIRMEREGESRLMNLLHAAFCIGGVLGPLGAGAYLSVTASPGGPWRLIYPATGALVLVAVGMFSRLRFPPEAGGAAGTAPAASGRFLSPLLGLFALMLLVYVSAEIGFSSWASEYFVSRMGAPASVGALMVSVLWLGLLAGRLGLSLWFRGSRQDLAILCLALVSTASVLLLGAAHTVPAAAIAVFVTGLGYSGVYPMVMTLVGRRFRSGRAVGIASTGGGIGSFAFPFLMGYLGEHAGIGSSFLLCAAASAVLALLTVVVILARPRAYPPSALAGGSRKTG